MKLVRELLILTLLLLVFVLALIINFHFFQNPTTVESIQKAELVLNKPLKPIRNQLGKKLFKENCAACHNRNMRDGLVGPALGGVEKRWENNDVEIHEFIRNSETVIKSGNTYARNLYEKWSPTQMPPFLNLKDPEIDSILNYINEVYAP